MDWLLAPARQVNRGLKWFEEALLCCLLSAMIILACLQIVLRDIFGGGLLWADPLLRYLVIWSGLLGAVVATRQGKHIAIDVASHLFPANAKPWLLVLTNLFCVLVCVGLTYAGIIFVWNEALYGGDRQVLGIDSWVLNLIFPIAFGIISLRFLNAAIGNVVKISHILRSPGHSSN